MCTLKYILHLKLKKNTFVSGLFYFWNEKEKKILWC